MKAHVPDDHGAVDVISESRGEVVVRPHHFEADTYPSLWFYFSVSDSENNTARITVENLPTGEDSYEPFWKYCLWSKDGVSWSRIPGANQTFGEASLTVTSSIPSGDPIWISEIFPLPYRHYIELYSEMEKPALSGLLVEWFDATTSLHGRPVRVFRVGKRPSQGKRSCLIISGQHAVEQPGKILVEAVLRGFHSGSITGTSLERILDSHDMYLVPLANPDGCYDGRMNSNAEGYVMDDSSDDSRETRAIADLIDDVRPHVFVNCHGWGNRQGVPPYEDVYRFADDDPLYRHLIENVPGCSTSAFPHLLSDSFRLESHARSKYGTHCAIIEPNFNFYMTKPDGTERQPSFEELQKRCMQYAYAIAQFCIDTA